MNFQFKIVVILLGSCVAGKQMPSVAPFQELTAQEPTAQEFTTSDTPTLEQVKAAGTLRSSYRKRIPQSKTLETPQANLKTFRAEIEPTLKKACYECHGSETAEGEFRADTLDPDLLHGEDVKSWLEVAAAVTNGEMPPEEGPELADDERIRIIAWLSSEIQIASQVRRDEQRYSSFRRMTRYEYNYALQDLLGLEFDFAKDLPPDPVSRHGFRNSSEMLHMSASQYGTYLELNRNALNRATVRGERPEMLYWGISAQRAATRRTKTPRELEDEIERNAEKETEKNVEVQVQATQTPAGGRGGRGGQGAHYKNTETGQTVPAKWAFRRAVNAWEPTMTLPEVPEPSEYFAVLPAGQELVVELGNRLPDEGTLRVRFRASRVSPDENLIPSVGLDFGWQGSNNSKATVRISHRNVVIDAPPGEPQFYQFDIPLSEIYPRNPVLKTVELGTPKMTNPSEYVRLVNTSLSQAADAQFDYVEVSPPVPDHWDSHASKLARQVSIHK